MEINLPYADDPEPRLKVAYDGEHLSFYSGTGRAIPITKEDAIRLTQWLTKNVEQLRSEVQWFAKQMEKRLQENNYEGGWSGESFIYLFARLRDEVQELADCQTYAPNCPEGFVREAADVANFAMMIAEKFK